MQKKILLLLALAFILALMLPGQALGWYPAGFAPPGWGAMPTTGMRINRSADADGYHMQVQLRGIEPQLLNIRVENGRWLVLSVEQSTETHQRDDARSGYGYQRSYSYSSSNQTRRISLPADANVDAMQRQDQQDRVIVHIPRKVRR